jgi:four helix bundle protein
MYGEVQAAESRSDFIHKMKVLLKELRETRISLRIINEKPLVQHEKIELALKECNELIEFLQKVSKQQRKTRLLNFTFYILHSTFYIS